MQQQAQRLRSRSQFEALLACPVAARTEHFVMHRMDLPVSPAVAELATPTQLFTSATWWIGAMAPKRWARRAVTRNLIKRQIYSLATHQLQAATPAAFLVRLRRGFERPHFVSAASENLRRVVRQEIEQLYGQLSRQ